MAARAFIEANVRAAVRIELRPTRSARCAVCGAADGRQLERLANGYSACREHRVRRSPSCVASLVLVALFFALGAVASVLAALDQ